jgi:hypothetical protein
MNIIFRIAWLLTEIPNTTSKFKSSSRTLSPVTYCVYATLAEPTRRAPRMESLGAGIKYLAEVFHKTEKKALIAFVGRFYHEEGEWSLAWRYPSTCL